MFYLFVRSFVKSRERERKKEREGTRERENNFREEISRMCVCVCAKIDDAVCVLVEQSVQ